MPDISLLQQEYEVIEEESRVPGIVLTVFVTIFLAVLVGWGGLYLYERFYIQTAEEISKRIEDLKVKEAGEVIEKLKIFSNKAGVLSGLRGSHASTSALFQKVEKSTHPLVRFESGNFMITEKQAQLKGLSPSAMILSRQIEIYAQDKNIAEFSVGHITYGKEHEISFDASLKFK